MESESKPFKLPKLVGRDTPSSVEMELRLELKENLSKIINAEKALPEVKQKLAPIFKALRRKEEV